MSSLSRRSLVLIAGFGLALAGTAWGQTPWTAPASEKAKKSPIAPSAKVAEQGEKVAKVNCVSCHGSKGRGDGAAAVALNPKPADWTSSVSRTSPTGSCSGRSAPAGAPCRPGGTCPRTTGGRSSSTSGPSRSDGWVDRTRKMRQRCDSLRESGRLA